MPSISARCYLFHDAHATVLSRCPRRFFPNIDGGLSRLHDRRRVCGGLEARRRCNPTTTARAAFVPAPYCTADPRLPQFVAHVPVLRRTESTLVSPPGRVFHLRQSQPPSGITAGDLNGDGKLDLVSANYFSNDMSILLGACAAPANLVATAQSTSQINLTWNAVAGATSYEVFAAPTTRLTRS
jgi:hypothetical protein